MVFHMSDLSYFESFNRKHEKEISQFFNGATKFTGTEALFDKPLTILCFTNRSGSNLLAEYLRITRNFAGLREQLNHSIVKKTADKLGVGSFPDYVAGLAHQAHDDAHSFGFKASWDQLLMLLHWNIPAMFSDLNIIHIEREDVVAQAVSYSIADQTKQWKSSIKQKSATAEYDFFDILKRLNNAGLGNKMIRQICAIYELKSISVFYEDIVADPVITLAKIHREIDLPLLQFNLGERAFEKQANHVNQEFSARFKREFIAHSNATAP